MTEEQEEIDGVHPENVCEMGLSVSCLDEYVDSTSKALISILMSVSLSNKENSLRLRHCDIIRAYFQGTVDNLIHT